MHVTLPLASDLPGIHFGQRLGFGEVGEFLVVEVAGLGIFGRLVEVIGSGGERSSRGQIEGSAPRNEGRLQLLSSVDHSGNAKRGIAAYPRLGDRVFVASEDTVSAVIAGDSTGVPDYGIDMGTLAVGNGINVSISTQKLFGRHTAVVGATGSGKSWTLAHLASSILDQGGRMILIDATGEFGSLGKSAVHVALGGNANEPNATSVSLPHWHMRETDRNAFIAPSGGSQLPKLRAAVRSLRMHRILAATDPARIAANGLHGHMAVPGRLSKASQNRLAFETVARELITHIENPFGEFDLRALSNQVMEECVWPTDKNSPEKFGGVDNNSQGYISSLVGRIDDLIQTPEIMSVIGDDLQSPSLLKVLSEWIHSNKPGIFRISLRNLTFSHSLREILVNVIGHTLLLMARRGDFRENPIVVGLDEAHQFFNVTVGDEVTAHLDAFDLIAKEGRKYGLTVCLATQRPGDLPTAVLSQVGMLIVHRLADGRDRQRVEEAAAELDMSAMKLLPGLVPGEAIFMGVDFPVPVSVRVTRPVFPPESEGPKYETGWVRRRTRADDGGESIHDKGTTAAPLEGEGSNNVASSDGGQMLTADL
ncbi:ATP-binding protein [Arthrobacter sp. ov407]|uniref:ATP-binding protein n=1 Tax=Arthrobacter sp. ov407 TaxID=1761748 RepID=UPI0015A0A2BF|nr:ATP-binding protein [Arthrobacter sp. ov407]